MAWSEKDVPDQTGRIAIVTGANSGIGLETARVLAQKGAQVLLACRNKEKGEAACADILHSAPQATVAFQPLDLSSLESVKNVRRGFYRRASKPRPVDQQRGCHDGARVGADSGRFRAAVWHESSRPLCADRALTGALTQNGKLTHRDREQRHASIWAPCISTIWMRKGNIHRTRRTAIASWPICSSCESCNVAITRRQEL